jgi:hypothetical protein
MIADEESAQWLALARTQSLRLADARAAQPRRWRPPSQAKPAHALRWAVAGVVTLLVLGSGAWALVRREQPAPVVPAASLPAPVITRTPSLASPPSLPVPPAKTARRKEKKRPPVRFEEGDGELILVAPPHEPPPPLFSPEEWKRGR